MTRKIGKMEEAAITTYEPLNSDYRKPAHLARDTEGKGINMLGLRWKYVQIELEEMGCGNGSRNNRETP